MHNNEGALLMTPVQFERAFRLAKAHGHEWPDRLTKAYKCHPAEMVELWPALLDPEEIKRIVMAAATLEVGIASPEIQGEVAHHITGSGRLEWFISWDGEVELDIHRPGEDRPVLIAVYRDTEDGWRWAVSGYGPCGHRHIAPILRCALALGAGLEEVSELAVAASSALAPDADAGVGAATGKGACAK